MIVQVFTRVIQVHPLGTTNVCKELEQCEGTTLEQHRLCVWRTKLCQVCWYLTSWDASPILTLQVWWEHLKAHFKKTTGMRRIVGYREPGLVWRRNPLNRGAQISSFQSWISCILSFVSFIRGILNFSWRFLGVVHVEIQCSESELSASS